MGFTNPLLKVFVSNKHFIVILLTGLAITTLLSTSFSLTSYYLESMSREALIGLGYHTIMYFVSNDHPWNIERSYENVIKSSVVDDVKYVYVEAYQIDKTGYFKINNHLVGNASRMILTYIPGLEKTLTYSTDVKYGGPNNYIVCGVNVSTANGVGILNITFYSLHINTTFFINKMLLDYELDKAFGDKVLGLSDQEAENINPYRLFSKMLIDGETLIVRSQPGLKKTCSLILFTGSVEQYLLFANYLTSVNAQPAPFVTYDLSYSPESYSVSVSNKYVENGKALYSIIRFDVNKLMIGVSVEAGLSRIKKYIIEVKTNTYGLTTGVSSSPIHLRLYSMVSSEQLFRFSMIISLLPSFTIIWITASKTPPILISTIRKMISLLRVRGISLNIIKTLFTISLLLWLLPGALLGFMVGPLLAILVYRGSFDIDTYIYLVRNVSDPLTIFGTIIIAIVIMLGTLRTSFKTIENIQPIEFAKPTVLAESPIIERGLSKLTILLIILSIYYVFRTLFLNPYKFMSEAEAYGIIFVVASMLMIILEPIVLLFGPIILIYSVANLLIAYPDKVSSLASLIASIFTKKYRVLVARFMRIKPARIALAIVLSSFATSLLIGGFSGIDSTNTLYLKTGYAVHGDIDYLITYPVLIPANASLADVFVNLPKITSHIGGRYSFGLLLIGVYGEESISAHDIVNIIVNATSLVVKKPFNIVVRDKPIPLGYLIFLNKDFTDIVTIISEIGFDSDFTNALKQTLVSEDKLIYIFNPQAERLKTREYDEQPYTGEIEVFMGSARIGKYDVICTAKNLPVAGGFYGIQGITIHRDVVKYSDVAQIPLYAPYERGVLGSIDALSKLLKSVGQVLGNSYLFGYILVFVKGMVDDPSSLIRIGCDIVRLNDLKKYVDNVNRYMTVSLEFTISTGISLFLVTLVVLSLISYSIIHENIHSYTIMRGRGVSSKDVYGSSLAEALSISILSMLPGFLLGIFLGYGLPLLSTQGVIGTSLYIDTAYGISLTTSLTIKSLIALILVFMTPIIISWLIVSIVYRKTAREAIILIGSQV